MYYIKYLNFVIILTVIAILAGTLVSNNNNASAQNLTINASSGKITQSANNETYDSFENDNSSLNNYQKSQTFTHGIIVQIDNIGYYFDGPADGINGTKDAPRHLYGLHYNIGSYGEEQWWSSDAKAMNYYM
jgi:hypothetical protein